MTEVLSPNTKAILLLTTPLIAGRGKASNDLLTPGEYKKLAKQLVGLGAKPADLLAPGADQVLKDCDRVVDRARLERLLARGFLLSQAVDRWHARAIWVVSRADGNYPQRLKARLREDAPAVLYGCGDRAILDGGGLAVVGSRNADAAELEYAQETGRLAALAERTLVSGGARGIDQAAMRGALEGGGRAIGVLADSLEKAAMQREHRNMLLREQLVLVSPYDPAAGFNVGHAMQRNKLIYAFADAALVVAADLRKGGTWEGAMEQLQKLHLVPVFARRPAEGSPGLDGLTRMGALPWPEPIDSGGLKSVLSTPVSQLATPLDQELLSFAPARLGGEEVREPEDPFVSAGPVTSLETGPYEPSEAEQLLKTVRHLILRLVRTPMNAPEVARGLGVSAEQAQKWLTRLVNEGSLEKTKRPVRYSARPASLFEPESPSGAIAKAKYGGRGR